MEDEITTAEIPQRPAEKCDDPVKNEVDRKEHDLNFYMDYLSMENKDGVSNFSCATCGIFLTNRSEVVSTRFTGTTGQCFLFNRVVNLAMSEVLDRVMITGRHMVRDVFCQKCGVKLGWMYESATEESQRYKEGRVVLERALVTESEGCTNHCSEGPSSPSLSSAALPSPQ